MQEDADMEEQVERPPWLQSRPRAYTQCIGKHGQRGTRQGIPVPLLC